MVAGKVKEAMGFRRSTTPTTPCRRQPSPSPTSQPKSSSASGFSRYFPRTSSAQVRPKLAAPAQYSVSDLVRLVEELQEKEARLKTELLEYKILKETVAVVPFLEKEIAAKNEELEREKGKVVGLEEENEVLRLEVERLREIVSVEEEERAVERRIEEMEGEIEELKKAMVERSNSKEKKTKDVVVVGDECSSTRKVQVQFHAHGMKNLNLNKAERRTETPPISSSQSSKIENGGSDAINCDQNVEVSSHLEISESVISSCKSRLPRVPRPPPTPTHSSTSSCSSSCASSLSSSSSCSISSTGMPRENGDTDVAKPALVPLPPPPPPPRPPVKSGMLGKGRSCQPPPPPPPPPVRGTKPAMEKVRRVPEVVEFYHSLMRRDSKRESSSGGGPDGSTNATSGANAKDMIGEIENRSAYLHAIKTEVETQGDFIRFLMKEVNNAAFTTIEDVVAFVKWLDDELSFLVDERAVLKHFEWPEKKADAMREAAFGYSDLKKLESEASSFYDDGHLHCSASMKKMQALLEKLEHGVYNLCRVREAAMNRYRGFKIPWEWMLDTGLVSQVKLASVKLAMRSMKRVSAELESAVGGPEEEELVRQGVRFAFRVHQFAGGFDVETMKAFQELRDKASSCQLQNQRHQNQNQQKLA